VKFYSTEPAVSAIFTSTPTSASFTGSNQMASCHTSSPDVVFSSYSSFFCDFLLSEPNSAGKIKLKWFGKPGDVGISWGFLASKSAPVRSRRTLPCVYFFSNVFWPKLHILLSEAICHRYWFSLIRSNVCVLAGCMLVIACASITVNY